jgi:hypothetical protein
VLDFSKERGHIMDLKKINMEKIRDFSRTSPIYFSLGFTLLAVLMNEAFYCKYIMLIADVLFLT